MNCGLAAAIAARRRLQDLVSSSARRPLRSLWRTSPVARLAVHGSGSEIAAVPLADAAKPVEK
jgi:hypothetical protein